MAKKESDILLIRKYLNGELDARAMHQLEARAQDDPFLMDAFEGYEKAGDQQSSLTELSARLQQRVERKEVRRIIPFRYLAIAASVLVVFTIGWLLMVKNKPEKLPQIANAITPPAKTQPAAPLVKDTVTAIQLAKQPAPVYEKKAVLKPAADAAPPIPAAAQVEVADAAFDKSALKEVAAVKPDAVADTTPLNELVVMNYKPEKKKDVLKDNSSYGYVAPTQYYGNATMEQQLVSKAKGVSKTEGLYSPSRGAPQIYVQGRIIDEIDRRPLPGVFVKSAGGSYGAVTDRNGKFYIPTESLKSGLVVSRLGYNTARVSATQGDSIKTISLAPGDVPLKGAAISDNAKNPAAAHPQMGWSKYDKYLGDAAVSPDGETGSVGLAFLVDKNGVISNAIIMMNLSDAANKKAIELVSKGPKWVGNANGKTEQVTLTINF